MVATRRKGTPGSTSGRTTRRSSAPAAAKPKPSTSGRTRTQSQGRTRGTKRNVEPAQAEQSGSRYSKRQRRSRGKEEESSAATEELQDQDVMDDTESEKQMEALDRNDQSGDADVIDMDTSQEDDIAHTETKKRRSSRRKKESPKKESPSKQKKKSTPVSKRRSKENAEEAKAADDEQLQESDAKLSGDIDSQKDAPEKTPESSLVKAEVEADVAEKEGDRAKMECEEKLEEVTDGSKHDTGKIENLTDNDAEQPQISVQTAKENSQCHETSKRTDDNDATENVSEYVKQVDDSAVSTEETAEAVESTEQVDASMGVGQAEEVRDIVEQTEEAEENVEQIDKAAESVVQVDESAGNAVDREESTGEIDAVSDSSDQVEDDSMGQVAEAADSAEKPVETTESTEQMHATTDKTEDTASVTESTEDMPVGTDSAEAATEVTETLPSSADSATDKMVVADQTEDLETVTESAEGTEVTDNSQEMPVVTESTEQKPIEIDSSEPTAEFTESTEKIVKVDSTKKGKELESTEKIVEVAETGEKTEKEATSDVAMDVVAEAEEAKQSTETFVLEKEMELETLEATNVIPSDTEYTEQMASPKEELQEISQHTTTEPAKDQQTVESRDKLTEDVPQEEISKSQGEVQEVMDMLNKEMSSTEAAQDVFQYSKPVSEKEVTETEHEEAKEVKSEVDPEKEESSRGMKRCIEPMAVETEEERASKRQRHSIEEEENPDITVLGKQESHQEEAHSGEPNNVEKSDTSGDHEQNRDTAQQKHTEEDTADDVKEDEMPEAAMTKTLPFQTEEENKKSTTQNVNVTEYVDLDMEEALMTAEDNKMHSESKEMVTEESVHDKPSTDVEPATESREYEKGFTEKKTSESELIPKETADTLDTDISHEIMKESTKHIAEVCAENIIEGSMEKVEESLKQIVKDQVDIDNSQHITNDANKEDTYAKESTEVGAEPSDSTVPAVEETAVDICAEQVDGAPREDGQETAVVIQEGLEVLEEKDEKDQWDPEVQDLTECKKEILPESAEVVCTETVHGVHLGELSEVKESSTELEKVYETRIQDDDMEISHDVITTQVTADLGEEEDASVQKRVGEMITDKEMSQEQSSKITQKGTQVMGITALNHEQGIANGSGDMPEDMTHDHTKEI